MSNFCLLFEMLFLSAVILCGVTEAMINKLQRVQNAAARFISKRSRIQPYYTSTVAVTLVTTEVSCRIQNYSAYLQSPE